MLPNALYAIRLADGRRITAALEATARHRFSRLIVGERVQIRPASHDRNRGQIIAKL
ncbi:MAG: hypothetical protein ACM3ZE_20680 [Myxococcales bacterium]